MVLLTDNALAVITGASIPFVGTLNPLEAEVSTACAAAVVVWSAFSTQRQRWAREDMLRDAARADHQAKALEALSRAARAPVFHRHFPCCGVALGIATL